MLLCFREADGKFLHQETWPRRGDRRIDWPHNGLSGSPVVEGNNVWFVNNRREVICLDAQPLHMDGAPRVRWKYDLVEENGVAPGSPMLHTANTLGSLAIYDDLLFVPTGNRAEPWNKNRIAAPTAPSLVCLRKATGELVWEDHSAGPEGWEQHHASPLVIEVDGKAQVVHAQADGWVRSFEPRTGKLIWKFDINPKDAVWGWRRGAARLKAVVEANLVFADGRIYFATSLGIEHETKNGRLFCIDPTKAGDISPEIDDGRGKGVANPASGVIWEFAGEGKDVSLSMHHAISCVAVHDGLAIAADLNGSVHCFDAKTGKRHWSHEMLASVWADMLIVDGKIYVADEDADVEILKLSSEFESIAEHNVNSSIEAPLVFANGVLYVQTRNTLYAIGRKP